MSKTKEIRGLINQRLSLAAEEIFELFERTIAEYEEQLCRSKEENERQQKLLEAVYNPQLRLHRADAVQLLEEVPPSQQERGPSLDQEDPPELAHIKEEDEDLLSRQETEQCHELEEEEEEEGEEEGTSTPPPVKSGEDDGEEPESSQLHENQTEESGATEGLNEEDCAESNNHLQPVTYEEAPPSEPEFSEQDDINDVEFSLNSLQNKKVSVRQKKYTKKTKKRPAPSSVRATSPVQKDKEQKGKKPRKGEKPFGCFVCEKKFSKKKNWLAHRVVHAQSGRYDCTLCEKFFMVRLDLERHMRSHTGEKPFSCSICNKSFTQKSNLCRHQQIHTTEKPFSCSHCDATFRQKTHLARHTRTHTGERPFSCSVCRKTFSEHGTLQRHSTVHTKQKRFTCSTCDQKFTRVFSLVRHKCKEVLSD